MTVIDNITILLKFSIAYLILLEIGIGIDTYIQGAEKVIGPKLNLILLDL